MTYYDWLKYKEISDNPDEYFRNKKVINFDMIYKEHKTVKSSDLKNTLKMKKQKLFRLLFLILKEMIYGFNVIL